MRSGFSFLLLIVLTLSGLRGEDCNRNGVPDGDDLVEWTGFPRHRTFDAGRNPEEPVLADFDGDGDLDLAVARRSARQVAVFLNDGLGGFSPGGVFSTRKYPSVLFAGDLSGDGVPDLATLDYIDREVSVFLNIGGSFERRSLETVNGPSDLIAADLDGDGQLELAASSWSEHAFSVFWNRGFVFERKDTPLPRSTYFSLTAADIDGDGLLDIAAAAYGRDSLVALINRGNESFEASAEFAVGARPVLVAGGDLDGDGRAELVAADDHGRLVLFSEPENRFGTGEEILTEEWVSDLEVVDVDRDGALDLLFIDVAGNVVVAYNDGSGRPAEVTRFGTASATAGVAAGDLDGDGAVDLAVANTDSAGVAVQLHRGDDPRFFEGPVNIFAGSGATSMAAADLDADGDLDLALVDSIFAEDFEEDAGEDAAGGGASGDPPPGTSIAVVLNEGGGRFAPQNRYFLGKGLSPRAIVARDLDRDGDQDLAVACAFSDGVCVFLNDGDGSFGPSACFEAGSAPVSLAAGDVDNDGDLDLVAASGSKGALAVLLNDGAGSFAAPGNLPAPEPLLAVIAEDLDADGDIDIAAALPTGLFVLANDGVGAFEALELHRIGSRPVAVVAADLDGDGVVDLATANSVDPALPGNVSILPGAGDGRFAAPVHRAVGLSPQSIIAADVDGDGDADLATADNESGWVSLLVNRGGGVFGEAEPLEVSGEPTALVAGDLDGDGSTDLAVANGGEFEAPGRTVTLLLQGTFPAFSRDEDGDGVPDECSRVASPPRHFHRGDSNDDGSINVTDAVHVLRFLFVERGAPGCMDALDADDSGGIEVSDAVFLLDFGFRGGPRPPLPGPPGRACGADETEDELECDSYSSC